jgi:Uma2 family endonuclease
MAIRIEDLLEVIETRKAARRPKVTFEEYLNWPGESGYLEWVDGEVIEMTPPSIKHQLVSVFLATVVKLYVQKNGLGIVLPAPVAMKLPKQRRGREPDILFLARGRESLLKKNYVDRAADVAVEIISPESVGRDRGDKFVEYEAAGVREYWLIDPDRRQAEFYLLHKGRYRLAQIQDGVFRSEVVDGFWLRVEWLWELPNELDVLRELGVI